MPEGFLPVSGGVVASDAGGITTDIINLADVEMCYVVIHKYIAVGNATAHTLYRGLNTTTCATAWSTTELTPIWSANPTTATTAWTREADAAGVYTQGVGVTGDLFVIFKVDPAMMGGYSTIKLAVAASGQANLTSIEFWVKPRYAERIASRSTTEFIA
jgi:hypothetical protein